MKIQRAQPDVVSLPERVFTPHSGLEGFRYAVRSMYSRREQAAHLAWRFFVRDTSAAYRQSLLGYVWLILPPLASTLVWVLLNESGLVQLSSRSVAYPIFVLSGTILWTAFNSSIIAMLGVIGGASGLLSKVNFPHESLAYSAFLKALVDSAIPMVLLLPALLFFDIPWRPSMLLFPVALLGCLALGSAIGLLALPIAALYSDIGRGIQFLLRFGFFVTPVIFALPASGTARTLMLLNPVTPLIVTGRDWLTASGEGLPVAFFSIVVVAAGLIAAGLVLLKVAVPFIVERVSN